MPHFLLAMSIVLALVGGIIASHQSSAPALSSDQTPGLQAQARAVLAWHSQAVFTKRAAPATLGIFTPTMPTYWSIGFMGSCAGASSVASWIADSSAVLVTRISGELRSQADPTFSIGKSNGTHIVTSTGFTLSLPCTITSGQTVILSQL